MLAFYVSQRRHEIGIRIALGANSGVILRQVLWRSALMVGPGLAVGLLASLAGTRVLAQFLYQVQPMDAATYVDVSLSLAAVAFAASDGSALRATRIDPVQALRGEEPRPAARDSHMPPGNAATIPQRALGISGWTSHRPKRPVDHAGLQ